VERTARTLPALTCKIFAVCKQTKGQYSLELIGPDNRIIAREFPASCTLPIYIRLTNGHGEWEIGMQLVDDECAVHSYEVLKVWHPESPRHTIEGPLTCHPVFPGPGDYFLVLTANGQEIGREPFYARAAS
jgi:hypothetical protein